jgi:DNA polymerase V
MLTVLAIEPLSVPAHDLALLALTGVSAGFPSPARDYYDGPIDLNEHLINDATSTFVVRVAGDSMDTGGISDGDEVIVDRSLNPRDGNVVIAVVDGELTIKRLRLTGHGIVLGADNPAYPDIEIAGGSEFSIWGVVTRCLHRV